MKLNVFLFIQSFVFGLSISQAQSASDCFSCEPLAEVSVTNHGLSKLLEASLKQNFLDLNKVIRSRAGFRDLIFDRSNCKSQTVSEAWKNRDEKNATSCLGMPDLTDDHILSGDTKLRPFQAKLSEFRLNQLDLDLVTPIHCEKLSCDIKVKLKNIDLEGNLAVNYTDQDQVFIPKSKLKLTSSDRVDVTLTGRAFLDPKTGRIEDLVFLDQKQTEIDVKPGSFKFDLDFKKQFDSKEKEIALKSKYFKKQLSGLTEKMKSGNYYEQQVESYLDSKVFREWALATDKTETREAIKKRVETSLFKDYGSKEALITKLKQITLPEASDDEKIYALMNHPQPELAFVSDFSDRIETARIGALAENAGFTSQQGFEFALLGAYAANQVQDSPVLVKDMLQPFLKKEVVPAVEAQVNRELANLRSYWNQISKVPSLNIQRLSNLEDLKAQLAKATNEDEKLKLKIEIQKLTQLMNADWLPIETEVFVDRNTREQKILRAQIGNVRPECQMQPRKFSEDTDEDFDLRTEVGPKAVQEYFNKMAENKKLDFCVGGTSLDQCKTGIQVKLKKPPQISCVQGEMLIDLDAEAKVAIFGADIEGQVKAEIKDCSGSPCVELRDSKGRLKNAFINTFFGSTLDHAMSVATNSASQHPISIPNVKLKKIKPNPQSCSSKLDWNINP